VYKARRVNSVTGARRTRIVAAPSFSSLSPLSVLIAISKEETGDFRGRTALPWPRNRRALHRTHCLPCPATSFFLPRNCVMPIGRQQSGRRAGHAPVPACCTGTPFHTFPMLLPPIEYKLRGCRTATGRSTVLSSHGDGSVPFPPPQNSECEVIQSGGDGVRFMLLSVSVMRSGIRQFREERAAAAFR